MNNVSQIQANDRANTIDEEDAGFMSESRLVVAPIDNRETFKDKAYTALRNVIVSSDVYRSRTDIRLDERQLA